MLHLREAYEAPIIHARPARRSVDRARASVRVGIEPDTWVVVETTLSRAEEKNNQAIPVGSTVRFTLQYGWRAGKKDNSNIIVARGTVVSPRTLLLPDSYGVRFDETVKTSELDPSVSLPVAGQVFLVAPWSIAAVEKAAVASTSETESYSMSDGSVPPEPVVSSTTVEPAELARSEEPPAKPREEVVFREEPAGSSAMTYVGVGAIVALAALILYVVI